eukprot:g4826.t1
MGPELKRQRVESVTAEECFGNVRRRLQNDSVESRSTDSPPSLVGDTDSMHSGGMSCRCDRCEINFLDNGKFSRMKSAVRTLIECIGEDPNRPGLRKTPARVAKALLECTEGYTKTPSQVVGDALFDHRDAGEDDDCGMVVVKSIPFHSMCEHHMLPFFGHCHVAYVPKKGGKVVGISKLARLVDMYARRLQIQERFSEQIAHAVADTVGAEGVAVVAEASHMCMVMRGVSKPGSVTVTRAMCGSFKGKAGAELRREFFEYVRK